MAGLMSVGLANAVAGMASADRIEIGMSTDPKLGTALRRSRSTGRTPTAFIPRSATRHSTISSPPWGMG